MDEEEVESMDIKEEAQTYNEYTLEHLQFQLLWTHTCRVDPPTKIYENPNESNQIQ